MSGDNGKADSAGRDATQAMLQPWLEFWTQLVEQRSDWTQMMMCAAPPNVDFATMRKRWLEALSKSIDVYLRTPAFLDLMRRNMDNVVQMKTTADLAQREMSRQAGVPHVEDIAGLYERLQTGHELLLARLHDIEQRLGAIEQAVRK